MLGAIGERERALYAYLRGKFSDDNLWNDAADAIRDAHAAKLKTEFLHEHDESELIRGSSARIHCSQCGNVKLDPRHNYDDPAWQAEAERMLENG